MSRKKPWVDETPPTYFTDPDHARLTLIPINLRGDHAASKTAAQLIRAQFDDWKSRFLPLENLLMNETVYMNPGLVSERMAKATNDVNTAYTASESAAKRNLDSYGIGVTSAQATTQARMQGLSKATALVDARNRTRQQLADESRELAIGGSGLRTA